MSGAGEVAIEFVDELPPATRGVGRGLAIDREVAALKSRPGQWALVQRNVSPSCKFTYAKRGCETALRNRDDKGRVDIYARWPEEETL